MPCFCCSGVSLSQPVSCTYAIKMNSMIDLPSKCECGFAAHDSDGSQDLIQTLDSVKAKKGDSTEPPFASHSMSDIEDATSVVSFAARRLSLSLRRATSRTPSVPRTHAVRATFSPCA